MVLKRGLEKGTYSPQFGMKTMKDRLPAFLTIAFIIAVVLFYVIHAFTQGSPTAMYWRN